MGFLRNERAEFYLDIKANESVFIGFPASRTRIMHDTTHWYLDLETSNGTKRSWLRSETAKPQVYRSSIKLIFHKMKDYLSDKARSLGFKMMFIIMPRSQEPVELSEGLYDCSVPHFQDFKPLLQCNHLVECASGEDERDCDFHSEQCGHGMIEAETKCYKLYRWKKNINWYDASSTCLKENMQLVTIATQKEHDLLLQLVLRDANFSEFYVGAQPLYLNQSHYASALYNRHVWRWIDGRIAFYPNFEIYSLAYVVCGKLSIETIYRFTPSGRYRAGHGPIVIIVHGVLCHQEKPFDILCEKQKAASVPGRRVQVGFENALNLTRLNGSFVQCPGGHVTRAALSCDVASDCGMTDVTTTCRIGDHVHVPMFLCQNSKQSVHYSLVCDHINHCSDKTDEMFCHFPPCPLKFKCRNGQCISPSKFCDGIVHCIDGTDEKCSSDDIVLISTVYRSPDPSIVHITGSGQHRFQPMNEISDCPATHFLCPFGECVPIFFRCNNMVDCPGREDEAECEDYTCPGFYRCLGSKVCLHPDDLCDGVWHCPNHDDEMLCDPRCPDVCSCQGLAFVCSHRLNTSSYYDIRLLDASGTDMTLSDLGNNPFLLHLNMSRCEINNVVVLAFPNLRILDLSQNKISQFDIQSLVQLNKLLLLNLSGNPLSQINYKNTLYQKPTLNVMNIDLSNTSLRVYNGSTFAAFGLLRHLNISSSRVTTITNEGFQTTPLLRTLDVRDSPLVVFPTNVIRQLKDLTRVYVDNYKLCCPVMLPEHIDQDNCHTKFDILSSCEDLLKSSSYRIFLWCFAFFAVMGNMSCLMGRIYLHKRGSHSSITGFTIFVSNLCLSDCFMGVYLSIVGVHDFLYQGKYIFHEETWKNSSMCKFAGILSLLSSEVSAFMISLITLDRLLVIRFPFSQMHFKGRSSALICVVMWISGLALATIPLLPVASHWEFFSQTGICLPLPFVGSDNFSGYTYSFSVMIVLNFVLFLSIACGQVVIYWSVRVSSLDSSNKASGARDAIVARRLITVVLSDFLCWFPIGLLGVMGSTGIAIPGEVNVAVAIFVMPLNSALNPFLYTLNVLKEKRNIAKERRLMKQLETRMAVSQIRVWFHGHVILEDDIQSLT